MTDCTGIKIEGEDERNAGKHGGPNRLALCAAKSCNTLRFTQPTSRAPTGLEGSVLVPASGPPIQKSSFDQPDQGADDDTKQRQNDDPREEAFQIIK